MAFGTILLPVILACARLQPTGWDDFSSIVSQSLPHSGRFQLIYEIVDDNAFGRDVVGIDFSNGEFVRVHAGVAYGTAASGRQFAGRATAGVTWTQDTVRMENAAAIAATPMELLRFVLARPELVESLKQNPDGSFTFEINAISGLPGGTESHFPDGTVLVRERWKLIVGSGGRLVSRIAPITYNYEYDTDPWPVAFESVGPTTTSRWELQTVSELADDAVTPIGATRLLHDINTEYVGEPSDESDAADGYGEVPEGYARDPSHRWSFALVTGGVLIILLGGGVLVRKRYAAA